MAYTSFNGKKTNLDEMEHQHLSNIYWFNRILNNVQPHRLSFVTNIIDSKFAGEILPYKPHPDFSGEVDRLDQLGLFKWDADRTEAEIWYEGKKVGYFKTKQHERDEKINQILEV